MVFLIISCITDIYIFVCLRGDCVLYLFQFWLMWSSIFILRVVFLGCLLSCSLFAFEVDGLSRMISRG